MSTVTVVILIVIVVVILVAAALVIHRQAQRRRTDHLKEQFGPEYDRSVARADDTRSAEAELHSREKRHQELELTELDEGQRRQFQQRWSDVQRMFVDDPGVAVRNADELVTDVMGARGYPVGEFDQRADDLSVRYPVVTQNYREARRVARDNRDGRAGTEELRGAVTSYRSLVDALLADRDGRPERDSANVGPRHGDRDDRTADRTADHAADRNVARRDADHGTPAEQRKQDAGRNGEHLRAVDEPRAQDVRGGTDNHDTRDQGHREARA